ncbi:MAG: MobA/MobL family protein [Rhodospirillales bacterium]|jgi:hypothetical protein
MAKNYDELDWEDLKAGRLDEGKSEASLLSGRGSHGSPMVLRRAVFHSPRKVAMARDAPGLSFRAGPTAELARRTTVAPFHMAHSFVSRPRSRTTPRGVTNGTRVAVFPRKAEVAILRAEGGRYHNRHHVWTLPSNSAFLKTQTGAAMRSIVAGYAHLRRRDGQGVAKHAKTIRLFQDYIERATMGQAQRAEELESDEKGLISVGNLGATRAERQGFWAAVEAVEKRADARLQCRIIAELPYWIQPADRRAIVERFGAAFEARQLGWWAAVHRPDVAKGSDPRNFHLHLVYHDRGFLGRYVEFGPDKDGKLRALPGAPIFEKFKDREARGQAWIVEIKAQLADIINDVVLTAAIRDGVHPVRLAFPGSYAELGITQVGQRHLGAKRTALERVGVGTRVGMQNHGHVEAEFARQDEVHSKIWHLALRLLLRADRYLTRIDPMSGGDPGDLGPEKIDFVAPEIQEFAENLARLLAQADAVIAKNDLIMAAFSDAEIARISSLDTVEAKRAIENAEKRFAEMERPVDFSRAPIALRDQALENLLEKAKDNPEKTAEIQQRRREMLVWEGAADVETAARHRRLIDEEWQFQRSRIGPAASYGQRVASGVAIALLATELAEQLAFWRRAAAGEVVLTQAAVLPPPVSMPPEGAFKWANGFAAAVGEPLRPRVLWKGSEADWIAYLIGRRLLEAQEAAKLLAAAPGARRLYDPIFSANFGIGTADLPDFFGQAKTAIDELATRQAPDPQRQSSKPIVSEKPGSNEASVYSTTTGATSLPQYEPREQPASTSVGARCMTATLQTKFHPAPVKLDGALAPNAGGAPPTGSYSAKTAVSDLANQRGGTPSTAPQKANANPPTETPLASASAFSPRATERPVLRPPPGPGVAGLAARNTTLPAHKPPAREDLTLRLPNKNYNFGINTSDLEIRRTHEARARDFTAYELYFAYSLTRRLADTLTALPFDSPDRRRFASQGDYAGGIRLLEEELYRRGLFINDLEKRFHKATETQTTPMTQPTPKPTATRAPAAAAIIEKKPVSNRRGGREL